MKDLKLVLRSNITNLDTLDNIEENTTSILIDEDGFYIELSDYGFFINDGWLGVRTTNIIEAITTLTKFKIENS